MLQLLEHEYWLLNILFFCSKAICGMSHICTWFGLTLFFSGRWGSQEPNAFHSCGHCGLSAHLLLCILWCVSCSYSHDALLQTQHPESPARGLQLRGLGTGTLYCSCGFTLCPLNKVTQGLFWLSCNVFVQHFPFIWICFYLFILS